MTTTTMGRGARWTVLAGAMALLAAVAVGAVLQGGNGGGGPAGSFMDHDELEKRVGVLAESTEWPSSGRPSAAQMVSGLEPDELVEPGYEEIIVKIASTCSWYTSWRAASDTSDAGAATRALKVMTDVIPGYYAQDTAGVVLYHDNARKAALGDASGVDQWLRANACQELLGGGSGR